MSKVPLIQNIVFLVVMLVFLDLFRGHIVLSILAFALYVGYVVYCTFLTKGKDTEDDGVAEKDVNALPDPASPPEISGLLSNVLNLTYKRLEQETIIGTTLETLYQGSKIIYLAYYQLDQDQKKYILQETAGTSPLRLQKEYPVGIGMVGQVYTSDSYIFADDLIAKETDETKKRLLHGLDALLSLPVPARDGGQHGALYIGFPKEDPAAQSMAIRLCRIASERFGNELDKLDTFSHVKEEGRLDKLTGLYNRKFFDSVIQREFDKAKASGTSLAYILLDLDYFKQMNDTHGHDFGDKVLITAANVFRDNVRESDYACRSGGDEFSLIIPKADKEMVYPIVKRIQEEYGKVVDREHLYAKKDGEPVRSSLSIGVAVYPNPKADSAESLIKLADCALYHVKESGKNSFCFAK